MKFFLNLILKFLIFQSTFADFTKFSFFDFLSKKDLSEKILPKNFKISPAIEIKTIQQRVNHFNPQDHREFTNFYLLNEEKFQPGGPLIFFFYITPIMNSIAGGVFATFGPIYEFATELNGTIVATQHRYYENSFPTPDLSDENLQFLTVAQSLEDLAHLITEIKSEAKYKESGVILVGWDYGASYATWFAQKYPHLVNGIWASGARVHQTLDQNQVVEIVENITQTFGTAECFTRSQNAFRELETLLANNQSRIIERTFKLCFPLPYKNDDLDRWIFFDLLSAYFYTYANFFEENKFKYDVCGAITNEPTTSDFEAFAYALGFKDIPSPLCYPISFSREMEIGKEIELGIETAAGRALLYQSCNEFGFFWNSGNGKTFFGNNFPIDLFVESCRELFGISRTQLEQNLARFNVLYGGSNPAVRNAYFTYGELYPWIDFGVKSEKLHNSSVIEIIPGKSLEAEITFVNDSPEMIEVRRRILDAAWRWLGLGGN